MALPAFAGAQATGPLATAARRACLGRGRLDLGEAGFSRLQIRHRRRSDRCCVDGRGAAPVALDLRLRLALGLDCDRSLRCLGDGLARPAATALICQLIDPRIKLEIEVTARKRQG